MKASKWCPVSEDENTMIGKKKARHCSSSRQFDCRFILKSPSDMTLTEKWTRQRETLSSSPIDDPNEMTIDNVSVVVIEVEYNSNREFQELLDGNYVNCRRREMDWVENWDSQTRR